MYHKHVVLLGEGDHSFEEIQLHALGGRVGRETEDHHLRLRDRTANGPLQFSEEIHARHQRHRPHLGAGNHGTVDVNRVARVGHEHGVALIQGGQHQMRQAFLGTDGDNGLAFRVDVDLVAVLVPVGNRPAQARNALGRRVAVGVFALGHRDEFFDDVRRRGAVGVAHAQVDDVFATTTGGHLQLGSDVENVRGESIYARKAARRTLFGHCCLG
ncbi:hypothetical protein D3C75_899380 [compost metagenome]